MREDFIDGKERIIGCLRKEFMGTGCGIMIIRGVNRGQKGHR
jgi:hypothetical protein